MSATMTGPCDPSSAHHGASAPDAIHERGKDVDRVTPRNGRSGHQAAVWAAGDHEEHRGDRNTVIKDKVIGPGPVPLSPQAVVPCRLSLMTT